MGSSMSLCDSPTPPVTDPLYSNRSKPSPMDGEEEKKERTLKLPFPSKYEEIQKEIYIALHPELFEGLRFEFVKPLNEQFGLTHSIFMGNMEIPTHGGVVYKCPVSTYEFGAHLMTKKLLMVGRLTAEGKLTGRFKYDVNDALSFKWQAQLSGEADTSQQIFDIELKGSDWNGQFKVGNGGFYGMNYFQSVTQKLALGGEIFYLDEQRKSGLGFAGRYASDKRIFTGQVSTSGLLQLSCLQKIDEKVSMAADFIYNANIREATTSLGYDLYSSRAHVRGKIDSNGVLSAYLEERIQPAITFLLSGSIDHWKKDYKFGFGLQLGE